MFKYEFTDVWLPLNSNQYRDEPALLDNLVTCIGYSHIEFSKEDDYILWTLKYDIDKFKEKHRYMKFQIGYGLKVLNSAKVIVNGTA